MRVREREGWRKNNKHNMGDKETRSFTHALMLVQLLYAFEDHICTQLFGERNRQLIYLH